MSVDLESYQRFVNTTPKPRATKKSKGELVGPPAVPAVLAAGGMNEDVLDGGGVDVVAGGEVGDGDVVWLPNPGEGVCAWTIPIKAAIIRLCNAMIVSAMI